MAITKPKTVIDAESAIQEAQRCLQCTDPHCIQDCPIEGRVNDWMQKAADGKLMEAAHILHDHNPLADICGRFCGDHELCQKGCAKSRGHDPLAISTVELSVMEWAFENGFSPKVDKDRLKTLEPVAIIHSGIAALSCCHALAKEGYKVDVLEPTNKPGFSLLQEDSPFDLEPCVVERHVATLRSMGVAFEINVDLSGDFSWPLLLQQGYAALFIDSIDVVKGDSNHLTAWPGVFAAYESPKEVNKVALCVADGLRAARAIQNYLK